MSHTALICYRRTVYKSRVQCPITGIASDKPPFMPYWPSAYCLYDVLVHSSGLPMDDLVGGHPVTPLL
jgi:hypothetical protein